MLNYKKLKLILLPSLPPPPPSVHVYKMFFENLSELQACLEHCFAGLMDIRNSISESFISKNGSEGTCSQMPLQASAVTSASRMTSWAEKKWYCPATYWYLLTTYFQEKLQNFRKLSKTLHVLCIYDEMVMT